MRWFDRAWVSGELDENEWAARPARYAAHLDSIRGQLGDGAELLVGLNLHDGQVAEWNYVAEDSFTMRLLAGDLQVGYTWHTLAYLEASLIGATTDQLARWLTTGRDGSEILYDEVSIADDGTYEPQLLLTEGEFGIRFSSLELSSASAPASNRLA